MSNDGSFKKHIDNCVKSCHKIIGMILRSFYTRNPKHLLLLFKTLVLSKMDYGSVLWSPNQLDGRRKLKKIQSNFTRRLEACGRNVRERVKIELLGTTSKIETIFNRAQEWALCDNICLESPCRTCWQPWSDFFHIRKKRTTGQNPRTQTL